MATQTLHFRVDKSLGELITGIAREHAFMGEFNIEKGLKALTDSFQGVTQEIAFRILVGDQILFIDEESQGADVIDSGQIHLGYYNLEHLGVKVSNMGLRCKKFNYYLRNELIKIKRTSVYFDTSSIVNLFDKHDPEEVLDIVEEKFIDLKDMIRVGRLMVEQMTRELSMLRYLQHLSEKFGLEVHPMLNYTEFKLPYQIVDLHQTLLGADMERAEEEDAERFKALDDHIAAEMAINKTVKKGIEPVDHMVKKWDAGFISPEGKYYALDGEISNLLHLKLADMLVEAGIIPEDFGDEVTGDSWLERHGWVKQHGDHILFGGYDNSKLGKKDVPITKTQLKVITEIIRLHYNGIIWPGFNPTNRCSVLRWAASDPLQFKLKWFAW